MRIGVNALYLIPGVVGGTERYLRNLVRALQDVDGENEYVVYTNRENTGTFDLREPRFREVRFPFAAASRPTRMLWEQSMLPFRVRRDRLDVLSIAGEPDGHVQRQAA